eukprot:TRINITY_DN45872_c0_g1_i1.p1 TRINITY_DN45872_c0_g1~~TRINITY_DN45872_c0_g1_i1.p1  ORF type:complete len:416 (+),score=75.80 TRINITY_DN45872_c0_g1_i1:62-1309(+)
MLRYGMRFFDFLLVCYALFHLDAICGSRRSEHKRHLSVVPKKGHNQQWGSSPIWLFCGGQGVDEDEDCDGEDDELSGGSPKLQKLHALPGKFETMLRKGQMFSAIILCSAFSNKEQGATMEEKEKAEVQMPVSGQVQRPTLLARAGSKEVVPFIWLGDKEAQDNTLYVAFTPMATILQPWKIYQHGQTLVKDEYKVPGGRVQGFKISEYLKEKLDKLWSTFEYNFGELLSYAVTDYPTHQIIFTGTSHGAALAQAAALRFCLMDPTNAPRVNVVTWNPYKWTDAEGSALVGEVLGDRILTMVLSKDNPRRWDSAIEYPSGFAPMPHVHLLDSDTGVFYDNVDLPEQMCYDYNAASRMCELHFADNVIPAVEKAMQRSLVTAKDDDCKGTPGCGSSTASTGSPGSLASEPSPVYKL